MILVPRIAGGLPDPKPDETAVQYKQRLEGLAVKISKKKVTESLAAVGIMTTRAVGDTDSSGVHLQLTDCLKRIVCPVYNYDPNSAATETGLSAIG